MKSGLETERSRNTAIIFWFFTPKQKRLFSWSVIDSCSCVPNFQKQPFLFSSHPAPQSNRDDQAHRKSDAPTRWSTSLNWVSCCTNMWEDLLWTTWRLVINGEQNKGESHVNAALDFYVVGQRWPTHHPQLEPVFSWSLLSVEPPIAQFPSCHKQITLNRLRL